MARIRTIKPEFFTSEDICNLSPLARLLYIALWCEADKEGRLTWKPRTFKLRYFPSDNCAIDELAGELVGSGMVVLYGDGLAYIPGFTIHQHVNPRESSSNLPAPDGVSASGPRKVGKSVRALVIERDGGACVRCGSTDRIEMDHILPQSGGGPHIAENLRVLCKSCNAARPVAGAALDADLARDGYSIQSLRAKFGIDASIPDQHAQGGREGKGRSNRNDASGDTSPVDADLFAGIPTEVVNDFKELRKRKKAPITSTAISGIRREAEKAGLSLEIALRTCCERGWTGFNADWVADGRVSGLGVKQPQVTAGGGRKEL